MAAYPEQTTEKDKAAADTSSQATPHERALARLGDKLARELFEDTHGALRDVLEAQVQVAIAAVRAGLDAPPFPASSERVLVRFAESFARMATTVAPDPLKAAPRKRTRR